MTTQTTDKVVTPKTTVTGKCNYCKKFTKRNTYCKYKHKKFAKRCLPPVHSYGITKQKEKNLIVRIHNKFRRKVARGKEPKLVSILWCLLTVTLSVMTGKEESSQHDGTAVG